MATRKSLQLITFSQEIVDGEPIYVSSNSLPIKAFNREPAGHAFHAAALRLIGHVEETNADNEKKNEGSNEKEQDYRQTWDSYSNKGKKKSGSEGKEQDHYALLGLGHLRYLATEEQIRKSYRETALRHHPDKRAALLLAEETEAAKQAKKDEIESHFKAVQEAYEVLIDPVKRRIYDSTDEFDDEIPFECAPQDFFKVFGPAFLRNGRWSVHQPIPTLGDENSTFEEVDSFYDFWYSFKSWREFPHADEFDVEQAESRDHKRWMERQNAKLTEKARKEEYGRIRTLVDNAYKRDPRILRRKDELKAEKQRKKEAKILAKKLQEEEAARIAEEERRKKEEDEKKAAEAALNQKKLKEKEKKLLRKERSRLRTLSGSVVSEDLLDLSDDKVEGLCMSLNIEQLRNLCDKMERKEGLGRAELLREALGSDNKSKDEKQHNEKKNQQLNGSVGVNKQVIFGSNEKRESPWGKEEIEMLRKGVQKYPKGTSRRWEVISEYIGTGRSVEEILKATKTVLLQKPDSAKAFDSFLEKRKPAQSIASPLTAREDLPGNLNGSVPKRNASDPNNLPESFSGTGSCQNSDERAASNGVSSSSDLDAWSAVQEKALVQALKTFPKETSQRWERISAAVPGKTVSQCKKKFMLMKDNFRNSNVLEKNSCQSDGSDPSSSPIENGQKRDESNTGNGVSSSSDQDIWSDLQEKALVQSLKTFPKETNQRWERVAAAVPGKTVNQCKKKFAMLKENFRNKKNAV
ncbi:dnaJ homolog subfamily C member 2-like [Olea europaea var. sylvestris]|uniref:DnaJ homolog subfamily C member 2-like n=1 Tax=Olea europaea subsp. europaea TaxID=158383 RepID=A0A8S0RT61_OLEEU|nr:dnaJ homolog subfamily C member 2-like [Olea europaea var. sylvestris]CAA2982277.1 dnaJ homolog subfamily C member 2-like [Olea europaea subsp. europaea]